MWPVNFDWIFFVVFETKMCDKRTYSIFSSLPFLFITFKYTFSALKNLFFNNNCCPSLKLRYHYKFFQSAFWKSFVTLFSSSIDFAFNDCYYFRPLFFGFLNYSYVFSSFGPSFTLTSKIRRTCDFRRNICFLLLKVLSSDEFCVFLH